MIEWRYNLPPLTARDARALNIALSLDFSAPNVTLPTFTAVPAGPFGMACQTAMNTPAGRAHAKHRAEVRALAAIARHHGYPVLA